jgi:DNA repair exonuclease SbcCD ATPase subunit
MGKIYQSLRGVVQETLHWSKANSVVFAPVKDSDAASLNAAMEELEKTLVDKIGKLKAAVRDSEAVVAGEAQYTEQVIEALRANIATLEAKLRETEDAVRRKDVASQGMEESLSTTIRDLQSAVKEKEEALESRDADVNDLKSQIDVLVNQLTDLELAVQQAKGEAASEAQRAEDLTESSKAKIATLEAQLRQAEQIIRGKDWTLKEVEQSLTAKIQDLESQVRNREKLLADRDTQVTDLNAELNRLKNEIKQKSFSFSEAEASDIQAPDIGTVVAGEQLTTTEEKPVTSQFQDVGVTSHVADPAQETVSRDAFERIIGELGDLTNVMDSIASLIVRNHVKALGESMESFPKRRLAELLDNLSQEIWDESLKTGFRERLGKL